MAQRHAQLTFPDRPRNLQIGDELNKGAWGVVYNGELEGRPVAVKGIHELLQQGGSEEGRKKLFEDFREECKKLQALSHPHVVGFIGAFNDPRLGPILVMEKMQENLRQFLKRWKNKLPLPKQLRISLEIIRGVAFLHQQKPPLIHRDLNDKNVMFSFQGVIKIGDFGQSKLKKDLYLTTGQPGMVIFMPPEALKDDTSKYNESLDIFSVGVLMLEIGTQREPTVNLYGIGLMREVERREKDLKVLDEDHPLRPQILLCLKDNSKERPKASDLQREVLALVDGGVETRDERLTSEITTLRAALATAREENASRREREAKLQKELDSEKKAKHELAERCEELHLQVKAYEEDFKAERRDRESAHDKFVDKEKEWMEQLENLTQERDRLTGNIFTLKDQLVARKRELEAKESATVKALKGDVRAVVAKKDEEIQGMADLIRGLQPIADKYKVLFAEKRDLEHQFDIVMRTNQEVQQMFRNMQSEKAAAESRVKELSMVVGQVTAENEALTQQNSHLVQQIELETKRKEAAKVYTAVKALKKDFGIIVAKRDEEIQGMTDLIRGLQPIADRYKNLLAENRELQHQIDAVLRTKFEVQQLLSGLQVEKAAAESQVKELSMVVGQVTAENEALAQQNFQLMQQNEIGSSYKHISVAPTPRPRTKLPKEISMNPVSTGRGIHPDSVSTGPSTEDDLPMPLTRPGVVPSLQPYVSEIGHEAHRYKKGEKAKAAPVHMHADDEEWPLDPNLTCPYCNVVFRRGQMREFRHHIDDCR